MNFFETFLELVWIKFLIFFGTFWELFFDLFLKLIWSFLKLFWNLFGTFLELFWNFFGTFFKLSWNFFGSSLHTLQLRHSDYYSDNWEPEFKTIFATWQLRVTLDSIRNSCDVLFQVSTTLSWYIYNAISSNQYCKAGFM